MVEEVISFNVLENDLTALDDVAKQIIDHAGTPSLITIQGVLGSGKTTIVQALCKQLGVKNNVHSPTFTIVNEYETEGCAKVYHLDMYRIDTFNDAISLGLEDYMNAGEWCFIEWPEIITPLLPEKFLSLYIETDEKTKSRTISLK